MADPVDTKIESNATGPKRVRGDSGEVEQHDLLAQIAAAKYLASVNAATRNPLRGLRFAKILAPGSTSDLRTNT